MGRITELLRTKKILVSDGAWGTQLQSRGLEPGISPDSWCLTNPQDVLAVAKSYVDAGSDLIETNSFGANKLKLEHYGFGSKAFEISKRAAEISREAAGSEIGVLASIGPTGKFLMMQDVTEEELYEAFSTQAQAFAAGGADAVIIETFYALDEAEIALRAVKENTSLEAIVTFTFDKLPNGSYATMMGVSPQDMARAMKAAGADIIGTNCGNGFENMCDIVTLISTEEKELPILVHANAGLPVLENGLLVYPQTPEIVASYIPQLIKNGVSIIGGCCGTTPAHIAAIRKAVDTILQG